MKEKLAKLEKDLEAFELSVEKRREVHDEAYRVVCLETIAGLKSELFSMHRGSLSQETSKYSAQVDQLSESLTTHEIRFETERVLALDADDAAKRVRGLLLGYSNNPAAFQELASDTKLHPAIKRMDKYMSQEDYWTLLSSPSCCQNALGILKKNGERWDFLMSGNNALDEHEHGRNFKASLFKRLDYSDSVSEDKKEFSSAQSDSIRMSFSWYEETYLPAKSKMLNKRATNLSERAKEISAQLEGLQKMEVNSPQVKEQQQKAFGDIERELNEINKVADGLWQESIGVRNYLYDSSGALNSEFLQLTKVDKPAEVIVPLERYQSNLEKIDHAKSACQEILFPGKAGGDAEDLKREDIATLKEKAKLLILQIDGLGLDKNDANDLFALKKPLEDLIEKSVISKVGFINKMLDVDDQLNNLTEQYKNLIEISRNPVDSESEYSKKLQQHIELNNGAIKMLDSGLERIRDVTMAIASDKSVLANVRVNAAVDSETNQLEKSFQAQSRQRTGSITSLLKRMSVSLGRSSDSESPARSRSSTLSTSSAVPAPSIPESSSDTSKSPEQKSRASGSGLEAWTPERTKTTRWQQLAGRVRSSTPVAKERQSPQRTRSNSEESRSSDSRSSSVSSVSSSASSVPDTSDTPRRGPSGS